MIRRASSRSCRASTDPRRLRGLARRSGAVLAVSTLTVVASSLAVLSGGITDASAAATAATSNVATTTSAPSTPATTTPTVVTYLPGTPSLATIASPSGCSGTACAPYDNSQGTPSAPHAYSTNPATTFVLPTYTATKGSGASAKTIPTTSTGGKTEPNVAVYPGATTLPYPAGVVGTPGPMDGYCGAGTNTTEKSGKVQRQPAGSTLPLSPDYFPHVVENATGGLTGYFDYRPKTGDEALLVATATATGKTWTYAGEALEQNAGYCPTADVNDDGEGHANIVDVDGTTYLYTLQRAAGDSTGVGLVVHSLTPTAADPLGSTTTTPAAGETATVPRVEQVGTDPDAFATNAATVTVTSSAVTIPVTTTGTASSPEQLVTGGFVDATVDPHPTLTDVFDCTVSGATALTGCKMLVSGKSVAVAPTNEILQVMGYAKTKDTIYAGTLQEPSGAVATPSTAKKTVKDKLKIEKSDSTKTTQEGFTNQLTGTLVNTLAPDRLYLDGKAIYCNQSNTNPTTEIETCTSGAGNASLTVPADSPLTGDPVVPPTAYGASAGGGLTKGLTAPDGMVGVLPTYPGAPSGSTIVLYTEKELNYYVAGRTPKTTVATTATTAFSSTIPFTPGPYYPTDMASALAAVAAGHSFTVSLGVFKVTGTTTKHPHSTTQIVTVTCTGFGTTTWKTTSSGATVSGKTLTGCTLPAGDTGFSYTSSSWIGAPGATTVPDATLKLTGEGKNTIKKLDKNNEDRTLLRVAYTTTGMDFSTAGLAATGIISGTGATSESTYTTISDPTLTKSPTVGGVTDLNKYAAPGTADATEMRFVGSAGTVITNPTGGIGLFLSGAWAGDGDSDAFNQIFYTQSSTGEHWSVPRTVLSTTYTFSASQRESTPTSPTYHKALTIGAYYEGRVYGPSVVQHTGKTTMVFAGYETPKGMGTAGTVLGTGYTGKPTWTIGTGTPALYRNILRVNLTPLVETETTLAGTTTSPVVGQTVTLSATVTVPVDEADVPTGTVTFADATGVLCTGVALGPATSGVATCHHVFTSPGTVPITATYSGATTDEPSASAPLPLTVGKAATATTVAISPAAPVTGQTVTATATVSVTAPGSGTPTGTVRFSTGQTCQLQADASATSPSGTASCTVTFTGTGSVSATYTGSTDFATSASTAVPITVGKAGTTATLRSSANPSVTGEPVTFTATVAAATPGGGTPTGAVTFSIDGTHARGRLAGPATPAIECVGGDTRPLTGAAATCTVPHGLVPGESPVTVTAVYDGSTAYDRSPVSGALTQLVTKDAATVTVTATPASPVTGEGARLSAKVGAAAPGAGTPTGTVTWRIVAGDGRVVACQRSATPLVPFGAQTASCVVPGGVLSAAGGPYAVSATYGGDSDFDAATGTAELVVQKGGSRTVLDVHAPSGGRNATITATVSGLSPASGTPTGTVTFSIDAPNGQGASCAGGDTVKLSNGRATCTLGGGGLSSAMRASDDTVRTTYGGDADFLGSSGGPATLAVGPSGPGFRFTGRA